MVLETSILSRCGVPHVLASRFGSVMTGHDLKSEIKSLLVVELNLVARDPSTILDDAPLFGEGGLGLDSLDALQIAMLIEERFGIRIPEGDEARPIFRSVTTLAQFVEDCRSAAQEGNAEAPAQREKP